MASYILPICIFFVIVTIAFTAPADEKPLDCPADEKYYKCALEACWTKCEHLKNPPPCPSIAAGCFQPSCECKNDYLRNSEGKCVPYNQCGGESEHVPY